MPEMQVFVNPALINGILLDRLQRLQAEKAQILAFLAALALQSGGQLRIEDWALASVNSNVTVHTTWDAADRAMLILAVAAGEIN